MERGERREGEWRQPAKREKVTGHVETGVVSCLMACMFQQGVGGLRSQFARDLVRARIDRPRSAVKFVL